jgi:hypothetical protein
MHRSSLSIDLGRMRHREPSLSKRPRPRQRTPPAGLHGSRLECLLRVPQECIAGSSGPPGEPEVARRSEARDFAYALGATFGACVATGEQPEQIS